MLLFPTEFWWPTLEMVLHRYNRAHCLLSRELEAPGGLALRGDWKVGSLLLNGPATVEQAGWRVAPADSAEHPLRTLIITQSSSNPELFLVRVLQPCTPGQTAQLA